eukprot:CAMPEP_0177769562 /NCGR_PEP_ID=MMETSP0491_2-20121128/10397_1 /TAXON_ID=63592 /ORGANISM="Tetraselmis chuii, Strain PLY429" /LENGTH=1003 /DNA_ID=CAMNT_0019286597 /DNA_START=224 /DNA_END=3235 /DNA_ORIENTATION=-
MTGQIALSTTSGEEWLLIEEEQVSRYDALNEAWDKVPDASVGDTELPRTEVHDKGTTTFVYIAEQSGNMLTPEGLAVMKQVEEKYLTNELYPDFCLLEYVDGVSKGCSSPLLSLFNPGVIVDYEWNGNAPGYPDISDLTQADINAKLERIVSDPDRLLMYSFFFDASFGKPCSELESPPEGCNGINIQSRMTRSRLEVVGFPLDNFVNRDGDEEDIEEEMEAEVEVLMEDVDEELFELLGMKATLISTELVDKGTLDGVHVLWNNPYLSNRDFTATVNTDLMWAAASLMAVATYIAIHTRSLMFALLGMLQVIFSFVLAIFVCKLIFQVSYMDMMIVLIIFVTLGIGADDVFVFVDAFKQSEAVPSACGTLLDRIDYTLHRSSKAIFITSLTTMVAFLMTSVSDLINIQAFGIFAGMNILFLFTLTILLMPPAVVIWERRFSWLPCCVCHPGCMCCSDEARTKVVSERERREGDMATRSQRHELSTPPKVDKMDMESQAEASNIGALHNPPRSLSSFNDRARAESQGLRGMERFFNDPYMRFLARAKYGIVIVFLTVAALGGWYASQLAPPKDTEAFMPKRHMSTKFSDLFSPNANFWLGSNSEETATVRLVWGIRGMDTSGRGHWDPTDRGEIIWDEEWDPTSREAQAFLLEVCEHVRDQKCSDGTTGCDVSKLPGDDARWLVRRTLEYPEGDETDCWIEDMQVWLNNTQDGLSMPMDPTDFKTQLRAYYDAHSDTRKMIGYVEGEGGTLELKYLSLPFTTTFQPPRSEGVTGGVMDDWEDMTKSLVANAPEGMRDGFMVGGYSFVWVFTQRSLVYNAVTGLGYVFAIAFVVINLATLNLLVSVVTTATIAGIVVTVLGVGAKGISDWDFGTAESIATVILIGFSMDYCLHIAGAYIESESHDRVERTRDALTHLGVSVVAGAITTILSGLFLWGTVMVFFQKFAFLITFTVAVSFLWSVMFLPAIMMILGPEGDSFGWVSMVRFCTRSRSEKVAPATVDNS